MCKGHETWELVKRTPYGLRQRCRQGSCGPHGGGGVMVHGATTILWVCIWTSFHPSDKRLGVKSLVITCRNSVNIWHKPQVSSRLGPNVYLYRWFRVSDDHGKRISEVYVRCSGSTGSQMGQVQHHQYKITFIFGALRPNAGHGLLILEVSRSHTTTHHSQ